MAISEKGLLFREITPVPSLRKPDAVLFPRLSTKLTYGLDMGWREASLAPNRSGIYVFYLQDPKGRVFMYGKVGSSVSIAGRFADYESSKSFYPLTHRPKQDGRVRDRLMRLINRGYSVIIEVYYSHRNPRMLRDTIRIDNKEHVLEYREGNCTSLERAYRHRLVLEDIPERWERQPRGPANHYINRV